MRINIKRMVNNLKRVTPLKVLQEAIVNSIHANATKIEVSIKYGNQLVEDSSPPIQSVTVTDNGDGFTKKNRDSFCEYGTEEKIKIGCKGVGRISFLRIFNNVKIKSFLKEEKKLITIDFHKNFNENVDINEVTDNTIQEKKTEITFKNILSGENKFHSLSNVKVDIHNHILPLLYFKKEQKQPPEITITLKDDLDDKKTICYSDLPKFEKKEFKIRNTKNKDIGFILHYSLSETTKKYLEAFYCANNLTVCRFSKKKLSINPIDGYRIIFLLTSKFLDKTVKTERDDFAISPEKAEHNLFPDFSWGMINSELSNMIAEILYEKYPELKEHNKKITRDIKEKHLHLADYLKEDINPLAGFIKEEETIQKAENAFQEAKQKFRQNKNPKIEDVSKLAGQELIEYILTRDRIISQLEELSKDKDRYERKLHGLLMEKGADTGQESIKYVKPTKNNIWLIDDKFMSYSYAASDKSIAKTLKGINPESGSKDPNRPDISIFFKQENDNHDAVIIELKGLGIEAEKKFNGLRELRDYAEAFSSQKNLKNIWYYLITNIDSDFSKNLEKDDFKLLFSTKEKVYFKYYDKMSLYLYVMSEESFISDARARNKTFLDLIRKEQGKNNT